MRKVTYWENFDATGETDSALFMAGAKNAALASVAVLLSQALAIAFGPRSAWIIAGFCSALALSAAFAASVRLVMSPEEKTVARFWLGWRIFWLLLLITASPFFIRDARVVGEPYYALVFLGAMSVASISCKTNITRLCAVCAAYPLAVGLISGGSVAFCTKAGTLGIAWYALSALARSEYFNILNKLRTDSDLDSLTGLLNRRAGMSKMLGVMEVCRRVERKCALYWIDMDFFKEYNDKYGHAQGDIALARIAQCIASVFGRASDVVVRMGGDEFVAVVMVPDEDTAISLGHRVINDVRALGLPAAKRVAADVLTVSVGIVLHSPDSAASKSTVDDLLRMADMQMYTAKTKARNALCYKDEIHN